MTKAVQEINNRKNEGLRIRAEIVNSQRPITLAPPANFTPAVDGIDDEIEGDLLPAPITVDFTAAHDGVTEKVTSFERKNLVSRESEKLKKICENFSAQSEWKFDADKVS